jgi:hypothetical protein
MKSAKEPTGWCSPGDLRKLSRLASQVVLNRVLPDRNGRIRLRIPMPATYLPAALRYR